MNWQQKAIAFKILGKIPLGCNARYFAQRRITRILPRRLSKMTMYNGNFIRHINNLKKFCNEINGKILFEFGAGWDLCSNIAMYCFGIERQIVVDLHRLARTELINYVIEYYHNHNLEGMVRKLRSVIGADLEGDLRRNFGIEHRAPQDAAATGLPEGSVDFIISTNTLEHIPREAIAQIMRECHRICHTGSTLSMKIDYSDHYAHSDSSISAYNFLKYSEEEWRKYNYPMHYQNRMRHCDYRGVFREAGFDIAEEWNHTPDNAAELIERMPVAREFAAYTAEELAICAGCFVLRKARA